MKKLNLATLIFGSLLLSGCNEGDTTLQDNIDTSSASLSSYALFNPAESIIPYPNNLLFKGTLDGTLNIPFDSRNSDAVVKEALNTLDGFSTMSPLTTRFSHAVDETTLIAANTVRLFEVTLSGTAGAVTSITRKLSNSEFMVSVDSNKTQLMITPLAALSEKTSYLVVLTNQISDENGQPLKADMVYSFAKATTPLIDSSGTSLFSALDDEKAQALEPLRQLTAAAEVAAVEFEGDLLRNEIILSWCFTTQSISDVLMRVKELVDLAEIPTTLLADTTQDTPLAAASIYAGTMILPYYLTAPSTGDPLASNTRYWQGVGGSHLTQYNPTPVATGDQTVPLLVTIPNGDKPAAGWPVVIFQHGITANRTSLLGVADTLASIGYAAVAIDLPLHGLIHSETDGTAAFYNENLERTFNLDLVNNTTRAPGPDGLIDRSGSHFINLSSPLTSRDNMRQAVADLLSLQRSLAELDYDEDGVSDIDTSQVAFIGHSLGAMVGIPFLMVGEGITSAVLGMPGGGTAKLLDGSATFGPTIAAGLAANGLIKGSSEYEGFMAATQMVLDSADPLNYTQLTGYGIHMIEVVGGNSSPPDQVIPNDVLNVAGTVPSPTAGTDPLWRAMGLTVTTSTSSAVSLQTITRFNAGHHSSLLTPNDALGSEDPLSAQVFSEMQGQIGSFIANGGSTLEVTNGAVLE